MIGALWFFFWQQRETAEPVWTIYIPKAGTYRIVAEG